MGPSPTVPYPPQWRSWVVLGLFCLASVVSVIDRGILTLMVEPLRRDLVISDLQISLLQGLSFGLFYAVMGVPLGFLADRMAGGWVLAAGIIVWSGATILGSQAQGFNQLFASRLLVGLGEAALAPCVVSMIADMFPPDQRGRPISVYLLGQAIATGIGLIVTAWVIKAVSAHAFAGIPVLQDLSSWRAVFFVCGVFGLFVAALMFTFREPRRRDLDPVRQGASVGEALGYLRRNWAVFLPIYAGFAVATIHTYGLGAWSATFLIRTFGRSAVQVGQWQGMAAMIAGGSGALLAGWLNDRVSRSGRPAGKFRLLMVLCLVAVPSTFEILAPSFPVGLAMVTLSVFVMPMLGTTMISTLTELMPGNMRGVAVSLMGLSNTLLGATMGPLLVATATQAYGSPAMVGASLTTVGLPVILIGCGLYGLGLRAMRKRRKVDTQFAQILANTYGSAPL